MFSTSAGSGPLRLKFGLAKNRGRYDTFATFLDLTLQAVLVTVIASLDFPAQERYARFCGNMCCVLEDCFLGCLGGGGVGGIMTHLSAVCFERAGPYVLRF